MSENPFVRCKCNHQKHIHWANGTLMTFGITGDYDDIIMGICQMSNCNCLVFEVVK